MKMYCILINQIMRIHGGNRDIVNDLLYVHIFQLPIEIQFSVFVAY